MMKIEIRGGSWFKRALALSAIVYFAKKLDGVRKKRRLKIRVLFVDSLYRRKKCRGQAFQITEHSYRIELASYMKPLKLVRTLAHEMIHVNQWLTGKMEDLYRGRHKVRWGARHYLPSNLAYNRQPWEIEAHKYEHKLAQSFIEFWKRDG